MPPRSGPDAAAARAAPLPAAGLAAGAADRLLRRLEWTVLRRLDGLLQGDYRTLLRGAGVDLADLREYQAHDDVRHIDWNVTARLGTPHVRVFSEDREMAAWFLLDLSPSVDFGPPGQTKRDRLTGFVAVLARLLTRHGNRVGALLFGHGATATVLPPRTGRTHVLRLIDALAPAGLPGSSPPGTTELHRLLESAAPVLRRRSTVFVVSDFLSAPGWEKPLAQLAQRHDVVAVRLLDPLEMALPDVGVLHLRDPETGEQLTVDTRDRAFRQRFARLAAEREAALRSALARAGADTLELATDDDLLDALVRFMELRGQPVRARRRVRA
ncbi:DUF58 domain-containing protein [Paracidovorax avenae]|uniref:DUF58 domain-containing protein n=1 Tax=Paracidovorax avenae TaxID=80867 RepID=UPI000D168D3B|nr:DUF58 domain-containing protein [Paracidovorax avenae]AVS92013.1 DUF58 domain-containing protein [Paracidovorax avenae]AVT05220.1 DUF58 domain-containing protein [Paracidovorax avenae]AVT19428.1 DUF58 domain-containing protein [Paracidovorax avenae]